MTSRSATLALTQPGRLRLYSTIELIRLPAPTWLVQDILPAGGLVGLYGPPGSGKSFIAIDLALSIASKLNWHGHLTIPGPVGFALYISAEGGVGVGKRAHAWVSSKGLTPWRPEMGWLTEAIPISSTSEDMDVLFRRLIDELEINPAIIVIDTLARCFIEGGDENLQKDMGQFIAGADRMRREFNSTVLVVHHTRKGNEQEERGSTAFRGAADTMLMTERAPGSPIITLSCNKQKDSEEFKPMVFELKPIPEFDSCVIVDAAQSREMRVLTALADEPLRYTDLYQRVRVTISEKTFKRALVTLREKGEITKENGKYRRITGHGKSSDPIG